MSWRIPAAFPLLQPFARVQEPPRYVIPSLFLDFFYWRLGDTLLFILRETRVKALGVDGLLLLLVFVSRY